MILLVAAGATSFAMQKKIKKAKNPNEIISVTMHRTVCFGRCPEYKIDMNKDGNTVYSALRFNSDTGIYKKNIGTKKAQAVINQFMAYRVDTCSERYENRIPDLPGIIFTIKYANRTQKIANANFGPAFLVKLAEEMDAAGKKRGRGWKRTGTPKFP